MIWSALWWVAVFVGKWSGLAITFAIAWWAYRSLQKRNEAEQVRRGVVTLDLTGRRW